MKKTRTHWNPMVKLAFRFIFCYYAIYLFPFPLEYLPNGIGDGIAEIVQGFWYKIVPSFGVHFLGITDQISTNGRGSGDTTFHYIQLLVILTIVVISTLLWTFLDAKRKNYDRMFGMMILVLRYYLAFTLFIYGFSKIFENQFVALSLTDLLIPYGASSPMGLLWKFMGYSEVYSIFTGLAEVIAGIFLLFRKTVRLGALICFGVMLNVFVINMSYDVPVKLYSAHLLVISAVISIPHYKNFARFFIMNEPTVASRIQPYFKQKKLTMSRYVLKAVVILLVMVSLIQKQIGNQYKYGKKAILPPLYGIYDVDHFIINHDTLPPLTTDSVRWKRLVVDKFGTRLFRMDESLKYANNHIDTINTIMYINLFPNEPEYKLKYRRKDSILMLYGSQQRDTLEIRLVQKSKKDFYLTNRGFHWINEFPANR